MRLAAPPDNGQVGSDVSASYALAGRLRLSMTRLNRQLRRRDPSQMTITQLSALASIVRSGPLSMGQLAEIENLPSPAATRLADKLEEAGLVSRTTNPDDRRGIRLVATTEGIDLLDRRDRAGNVWLAERLAALSSSDRRALERAVIVLEALAAERTPDGHQPDGPATGRGPRLGSRAEASR